MLATVGALAGGLVFLYLGAEGLVRGSSRLALRLGVTPLAVGLTVVAFGTSSPELTVSLKAALAGNADIALGNVVGSNICNIALILGLCALIRPLAIQRQVIRQEIPIMILSSLVLALVFWSAGGINRLIGFCFLSGMVLYSAFSLAGAGKKNKNQGKTASDGGAQKVDPKISSDLILIAAGLGMLVAGGHFLVTGAVDLALRLGLSEAVVGLTIVAIGTSMPELATSVVAALKKEADLAVGNVIGSNIFNILAILGLSGLIQPMKAGGVGWGDLGMMIGVALLTLPLMRTGFRLSRLEGGLFLCIYAGYLIWLVAGIGAWQVAGSGSKYLFIQ